MRIISCTALVAFLFVTALAASIPADDEKKGDVTTLEGTLTNLVEGGWGLKTTDKLYDLHGDPALFKEFKAGDRVSVTGKLDEGVCIHMQGTPFKISSIAKAPEKK